MKDRTRSLPDRRKAYVSALGIRPQKRLRAFARADDGALAIWSLFMFIMMLAVGGIGADLMMNEMRRTKLQNTLDRAVLAAADLDQTLDPTSVVEDYFAKSGMSQYLGAVVPDPGLNYRTVTADASAKTDTLFMRTMGVGKLTAKAHAQAEERIPNIEISLVLDISGSMRFNDRIGKLKPAAKSFISTVLRGDAATTTSINLIPYAGMTNPGRAMFDYLDGVSYNASGANYFPERARDIKNVVFYYDTDKDGDIDRVVRVKNFDEGGSTFISNDMDEYYASMERFARVSDGTLGSNPRVLGVSIASPGETNRYYQVHGNANEDGHDDGPVWNWSNRQIDTDLEYSAFHAAMLPDKISSCVEIDDANFSSIGLPLPGSDQVAHFMYWDIASSVMDWGWCPEEDTRIQYAQNDEQALHTFIDNIRMHDGTGTHYAMKYGLATLDNAIQPAFAHLSKASIGQVPAQFSDRPSKWNTPKWAKYIVLMTDGKITEQVRPKDYLDPLNATKELEFQSSSKRTNITSASTNVQSFYAQCNLAKANGVTVYTIAFEVTNSIANEMRNCASSPSHFFKVEGVEISTAFKAIAGQINQLRLTQ